MYLIDTNIWLERLLDQELSNEIYKFFNAVPSSNLFISEFALYSIGISLCHLERYELLKQFLRETFLESDVRVIRLDINNFIEMTRIMESYNLDFDDAYQYFAAEKRDLIIISLDRDFDRTPRGRKTPSEILNSLKNLEQKD